LVYESNFKRVSNIGHKIINGEFDSHVIGKFKENFDDINFVI